MAEWFARFGIDEFAQELHRAKNKQREWKIWYDDEYGEEVESEGDGTEPPADAAPRSHADHRLSRRVYSPRARSTSTQKQRGRWPRSSYTREAVHDVN